MSIRSWWEERKRRQAERDALEYGDWEQPVWADPAPDELEPAEAADDEAGADAEPEPEIEAEPEAEPVGDAEAEPEVEPEPDARAEAEAEEDRPLIPRESWWKRRLLGGPDPEPGDAVDEPDAEPGADAQPEPDLGPAAEVEPEPEILPDEVEVEPEPGPEPELEAEPEELVYDLGPFDDEELLAEPEPEIELEASSDDLLPPVGTDVPGPRRARLEGERRRRRRRELRSGLIAAAVAMIVGIVGAVSILARDEAPLPPGGPSARGAEREDTITTTLLFGTKERRADAGPTWMTLLSYDSETGKGAVIYIPAHTATGIPGRGLLPVGDGLSSGGVPLLLLATETLLGTGVDQYVELSDADAAVLFGEIGSLTIDVPEDVRLSAGPGQARLIFGAGPQRLTPELMVDLLYLKGLGGDDVDLGARHLAFWGSLFEAFSFDADGLGAAIARSGAALGESDASLQEIARLFERLAAADTSDRTLALLPVRQVGVGGSELYQGDEEEVEEFLRDTVGEQAVSGKEVRVQILNGNGAPGIGQYVAERLGGEEFRVILSGNARRLNYRETLVITYDRSAKGLGLAERTRDLIGVGEVQVAAQSQGIVDLTIVVGKDFLETL